MSPHCACGKATAPVAHDGPGTGSEVWAQLLEPLELSSMMKEPWEEQWYQNKEYQLDET